MEQIKTLLVDETQEMPLSDFSSPVEAVQDIKTVIVHDASDSEQHQENENTAEEEGIAQVTSDKNTVAAEESEVIAEAREEHEDVIASDDAEDSECNAIEAEETDLVDTDVTVNDTQKAEAAEEDVEKLKDPLIIVTAESVANLKKESFSMDVAKLTLSIDDDGSAENHTPVAISRLVVDEAMTTLDGTVQFPQEMELASPTAIPDVLAATTDLSTEDTIEPGLLEADANEFGGQVVNEGKSEEDDHATITAVIESAEKSVPVDANLEGVLEKIRTKLSCESVQVLESGEIEVLPKGWSTRQSKSNDGKRYYVSPYGHTQWLRPPMKTGVIYNWVHEIEVTFGPGRLGLNLKQIAGLPGTKFTDLQVHIVEIYKLPNGMASPAEIYNWSVKPEKRLAVNMRITMMNGIPMTGYTYSQVLELLARLMRPVHIKFADITKGIVGRADEELPHEDSEEVKEARAARVMQNLLRMEYFQILVSSELHKQVWATMKQHIRLKCLEMRKKCEVMEMQVEREQRTEESLEKERENLISEEYSFKDMIEKLDMQVSGEIESPEVLRTAELVQRAVELDNDVTEIITENAELQAARVKTEETLDCLQKELDEYGDLILGLNGQQDIKFFSPAFLGSMVQRGSIDTRAEDARERLLLKVKAQHDHLEEEIKMEEERAEFVQSEIYQFKNQMDVAAAAVKREDAFISGERPPQLIFVENKIALLRKKLRETVSGIAAAISSGDQQQAENLSLRRADLKDDLKAASEEMRRMENELQVFFDVDKGEKVVLQDADSSIDTVDIDEAPHERVSELQRLQNKLIKLQAQLHDTVVELTKAADEKDDERKSQLGKRRFQLKDEMKVIQDQFQLLTKETLNVSAKAKDSYLRPSVIGSPSIHDVPRRSSGGTRASLGGIRDSIVGSRVSMGGNRTSMGGGRTSMGGGRTSMGDGRTFMGGGQTSMGGRASNGGNRASTSVRRVSEQFDPNRSRRGSSSASVNALTQAHDSNSYQIPRDGSLPTMNGILRKHATHSNEKGTFGNMSLRGVRERWFNIESDGFLRYYKREGDREPRGSIPLKNKSLEILYGKEVSKPNEFMICSPTQQTRMIAKNQDEMLKWVKVLELAHAYFIQQPADNGLAPLSADTTEDQESEDLELSYRNKRATLGF